jgi:hypothetical protein
MKTDTIFLQSLLHTYNSLPTKIASASINIISCFRIQKRIGHRVFSVWHNSHHPPLMATTHALWWETSKARWWPATMTSCHCGKGQPSLPLGMPTPAGEGHRGTRSSTWRSRLSERSCFKQERLTTITSTSMVTSIISTSTCLLSTSL